MQKNSTDYIAKQAWNMTKTYWQELMLLPILAGIIFMALQALNIWIFVGFDRFMNGNFTLGAAPGLISFILNIAAFVFAIAYSAALLQWCEKVHGGGKDLDVMNGLRFGVGRFWATLWTMILTTIKIILWLFLLVIPGLYKGVQYRFSIKAAQLEKVSGGDANRISQMLVMNSGFLRTIGNWQAVSTVATIAFYIALGLSAVLGTLLALIAPALGAIVFIVLIPAVFIFFLIFLVMFKNFHYLAFREENQAELTKLKKALSSM
jgi:hypothetical protein